MSWVLKVLLSTITRVWSICLTCIQLICFNRSTTKSTDSIMSTLSSAFVLCWLSESIDSTLTHWELLPPPIDGDFQIPTRASGQFWYTKLNGDCMFMRQQPDSLFEAPCNQRQWASNGMILPYNWSTLLTTENTYLGWWMAGKDWLTDILLPT